MRDDDLTLPDTALVSPSTGLDSELRAFMARLMTGYEAAHRRMADLCDLLAVRAEKAEGAAARALELQLRLAEEREELISRRHQRELEATLVHQRHEAMADITRDMRALMPLIGKKLLGVPLTGNDSHGLQDLLGTLTPEQISDVIERGTLQLSPAQRQLLGATLASLASSEKPGAAE